MKQMKKKLQQNRGETIVETLYAMIVIVLAFTMLCGAVVASARVNRRLRDNSTVFHTEGQVQSSQTVTIDHSGTISDTKLNVIQFETKNGYIYYEYEKSN